MRWLLAAGVLVCGSAHAEGWAASGCGDEPAAPHYSLATRDAYNDAVAKVGAYQTAAKAYSACVIGRAHAEQTAISKAAQDRIADIQVVAVATQQEIYGRMAAQGASFKAAAARLKAR